MSSKQIDSIQLLRAVATLAVVVYHTLVRSLLPAPTAGFGAILDGAIRTLGHFGVDIFFVISGFIMTLLIKNRSSECNWCNAVQFFIRRVLRIYPLYWITLWAVVLLPFIVVPNWHPNFQAVFKLPEMLLYGFSPENPVTWTLSFEMRFYMIATIAMFAGSGAVPILILWGCFQIIWVLMTALGHWPEVDLFSDGLSLEFILGVLIAYAPDRWRLPFPRIVALLALFAAFFAPAFFAEQLHGISNGLPRFLGSGIPAAIIVAAALSWHRNGVGTPKIFIFIGNISYSIYMWHWILFILTTRWFDKTKDTPLGFTKFLIVELALTLVVSVISFYAIEQPSNKVGSRLARLPLFSRKKIQAKNI